MRLKNNRPRTTVGAVPGSLNRYEFAQDTRVQLIEFSQARHDHKVVDSSQELNALLRRRHGDLTRIRPRRTTGNGASVAPATPPLPSSADPQVTWINMDGLANVDLLHALGEEFGLHALALEDVVNVHQHAKTEAYDTNIFTVFIPMSFIAGVYGMNFDSSVSAFIMPELRWALGYPFAIILMLCIGGGLLVYLRRNGWL